METDRIAEQIEAFIRREATVDDDDPTFGPGLDLLDAGYLDSLGFLHLLAFIAEQYDVRLSDEELMDPEFATINGIATAIRRPRG